MRTRLLLQSLMVVAVLAFVAPVAAQSINYDMELENVDREIAKAEREAARYSGGLILTMLKLRIEFLRFTKVFIARSRLQEAFLADDRRDAVRGRLPNFGLRSNAVTPKLKEIGLLCGKSDYFGLPVVIKQKFRKIAYGDTTFAPYTELDDVIRYKILGEKDEKWDCRLNRYTLEEKCGNTKNAKSWSEKCKWIGRIKIPDSGKYLLNCSVPGKLKTKIFFKIAIGKNSTIKGGYLTWKKFSNGGKVVEKCDINRVNGSVFCSVPGLTPSDTQTSKRWGVLEYPFCRMVSPRF